MSSPLNLELIKETRSNLGYTQQQMAEIIGINSKSQYNRRENGEYSFKMEELPVLAQALGLPYEKIFKQNVAKTETIEQGG